MKQLILAAGLLVTAFTAYAGEAELSVKPGYVDFGSLNEAYGEPRVMINLDGSLLKLVSAMDLKDPAASEALRNLDSVRVHVYDTEGDLSAAQTRMESVKASMEGAEWEQIVRAREDDSKVDIYVKQGADSIHGVLVMAVDGEEAVFVNVLGDINPTEIASIVDQVDMDVDLSF